MITKEGILDAIVPSNSKGCIAKLHLTPDTLAKEMDLFSRNFKIEHYNNAVEIATALNTKLP